jgi:hypothetical protein
MQIAIVFIDLVANPNEDPAWQPMEAFLNSPDAEALNELVPECVWEVPYRERPELFARLLYAARNLHYRVLWIEEPQWSEHDIRPSRAADA